MSKGQLVANVLNSQYAGTGATWRINTKILSTCRGRKQTCVATRTACYYYYYYHWWDCVKDDMESLSLSQKEAQF